MVGRSPVAEAWILALSGTVATSMPGRRGPCSGSICGIAAAARSAGAARPVPFCCGPETRVAPTARAVFPPPDSLPSPARWLAAGGHNGTGADIRPKEEVRMKPRQAALGRAPQNGGSGAIGRRFHRPWFAGCSGLTERGTGACVRIRHAGAHAGHPHTRRSHTRTGLGATAPPAETGTPLGLRGTPLGPRPCLGHSLRTGG